MGNTTISRRYLGIPGMGEGRKKLLWGEGESLGTEGAVGSRAADAGGTLSRPLSPRCSSSSPHYPRLLPSAGARPGPSSGWVWLRRSRHVAQQDATAPAAAPQTKPPRKRRWRGKAAMTAAGRGRKGRGGRGPAAPPPGTAPRVPWRHRLRAGTRRGGQGVRGTGLGGHGVSGMSPAGFPR